MIIIVINCFIIIISFRNGLNKALTEIFQFRRALLDNVGSNSKKKVFFPSNIGNWVFLEKNKLLKVDICQASAFGSSVEMNIFNNFLISEKNFSSVRVRKTSCFEDYCFWQFIFDSEERVRSMDRNKAIQTIE
jgi:hypothetical protein